MQDNNQKLLEYFKSLGLTDWTAKRNFAHGGQANIVEVVNNKTGDLGVFRTLGRKDATDIERFYRELNILIKTKHANIIEILDYTKDQKNQWYISKKGERFETYWKTYLEKNYGNPDVILEEAIRILNGITDGLVDLHKQGVVHRDIKAKNIVLDKGKPILIDFGVAFVTGEERLTPLDQAVGNIYSPDPALNFMKNVPPWLDVFLLSQLLIWMVSEGTNKPHIQRPLDWRWVVYPKFSDSNILKLRALTSLCSIYSIAPKNAIEFKTLLLNLFSPLTMKDNSKDSENINKSFELIQKAFAFHKVNLSNARSLIETRLPFFVSFCKEIETGVTKIVDELKNKFPIKPMICQYVEYFVSRIEEDNHNELKDEYYSEFGYILGQSPNTFTLEFKYHLFTKKGGNPSHAKSIENVPYISFTLNNSPKLAAKGRTLKCYVIPQDNCVLQLFHEDNTMKEVAVDYILTMVKDSLIDPTSWEIVCEAEI